MELFSGDREGSTEDPAGRKNSRIKSLKTRLFRRSKKTSKAANVKLSQSASDVTAEKGLGSDEDLVEPIGTMGSRAFSHDSIFLDDQVLTDDEPARVLSQENVPGKIKALQMKLQLQKMHFGPPPMVLESRCPEEPRSHLEDFSFHSSNNASGEETLAKTSSYPASPPISPLSKSAPTKFQLPTPFNPFSGPTSSSALAAERPLDFSSPPEFTAPLDTSAARHRLSVKPRNQRASTKKKSSFVSQSGSPLHILKPSDQYEFVKEEKGQLVTQEGQAEELKQEKADVPQHLLVKSVELSPVTSEAAPKLSNQQEHEEVASQVPQVSPLRQVETAPAKQSNSSSMQSKMKEETEKTEKEKAEVSQHILVKSAEQSPVTSETLPKLFSQQEHEVGASQIPWVKPLRRVETAPAKRPHSSFIESEIRGKTEETKGEKDVSQHLLFKSAGLSPVTLEAAPKLTSQQDHETVASQILRAKPLRRVDTAPAKRPHSSFIESEIKGGAEKTEKEKADISQGVLLKSIEPKLSSQKEHENVASQILRVKPLRRVDAAPAKRPHSSFIESEIKEKREGGLEIYTSGKKTDVSPEHLPTLSSLVSRSSFAQQQCHGAEEHMREIKRPPLGTSLFHSSSSTVENQEEEKPQSGSFDELLKQTEAMGKITGKTEEKENEELKKVQLKGTPFAAERLKQEGSPSRGPAVLWDRKSSFKKTESVKTVPQEPAATESEETERTNRNLTSLWDRKANLKKAESATPVKNVSQVSAVLEGEEVESSQELVDVAEEAKEEGKKAFGIKLRSTSLSLKFRSETNSFRCSKDDQDDKRKRQETGNIMSQMSEKVPTNTDCVLRPNDSAPSGMTLPVKHSTLLTDNPPAMSSKVQTTPSNNKEAETTPHQPQPTPQISSSEVSWMSLAMEKTKSLQQLFTSRFPRDLTGLSSTARPQAHVQPKDQTEVQIQTKEDQQSTIQPVVDTIKEELVQIPSQEHVVKPSTVAMQRKLIESQMSKQPDEGRSQTNTAPTASQPAQSTSWMTQSPLRSHSQTTTSQSPQGSPSQSFIQSYLSSGQQQPSWSNRGFQAATQVKPSVQTPEVSGTSVPVSDSSLNKESPSLSSRPTIWTGSAVDRAAFLEKRAEWTSPPLFKGVELKKPQTEVQTSVDTSISTKAPTVIKDTVTETRQAVKSAASSPIRVPERPREDRWPRKNAESPSSPSLLHTRPSVLQSDSSQPSWMELAKRKSMAWSDKSMD